jgi:lipoate-protein ligase A
MEMSAPESYCHIHRGVQAALKACGIVSELTPTAHEVESDACFAKPVKFDIISDAGKLSGAAQRRTREGLLHQGSILLPDPAHNAEVRTSFAKAFAAHLELVTSPGELTSTESARAADLERERYSTEAWNRAR